MNFPVVQKIHRMSSLLLILFLSNACVAPKADGLPRTRQSVDTPSAPITTTLPISTPLTTTAAITQVNTVQAIPATPAMDWQTFTSKQGISFRYPNDWQVALSLEDDHGFGLLLRPPLDAVPDPYTAQISTGARPLPKEKEASLYYSPGDVIPSSGEGPPSKVVWSKTMTLTNTLWHLAIIGQTDSAGGPWADHSLESIGQKGGMTTGIISATHYDEKKQLAIIFSRVLELEMLITLDQKGGDAVFPDQLPVFVEMLESVAIQ